MSSPQSNGLKNFRRLPARATHEWRRLTVDCGAKAGVDCPSKRIPVWGTARNPHIVLIRLRLLVARSTGRSMDYNFSGGERRDYNSDEGARYGRNASNPYESNRYAAIDPDWNKTQTKDNICIQNKFLTPAEMADSIIKNHGFGDKGSVERSNLVKTLDNVMLKQLEHVSSEGPLDKAKNQLGSMLDKVLPNKPETDSSETWLDKARNLLHDSSVVNDYVKQVNGELTKKSSSIRLDDELLYSKNGKYEGGFFSEHEWSEDYHTFSVTGENIDPKTEPADRNDEKQYSVNLSATQNIEFFQGKKWHTSQNADYLLRVIVDGCRKE